MPSKSQLHSNWEAASEGFDSRNHSDNYSVRGSGNASPRRRVKKFTGKKIGTIWIDPEMGDIKIDINKDKI